MRRPFSLFRSLAPLALALPLAAAEDDCDVTIHLDDGSGAEEGLDAEDTDRDGLNDEEEQELGTDPENPDTDGDGIIDGADDDSFDGGSNGEEPGCDSCDVRQCASDADCGDNARCFDGLCEGGDAGQGGEDPNRPGEPGAEDSDGDGLDDESEGYLGCDPNDPDSDDDGVGDLDELMDGQTDPNDADTDDDGVPDGEDAEPCADGDNDGLSDYLEELVGTDPGQADTDGDGANDGEECFERGTDPLWPDQEGGANEPGGDSGEGGPGPGEQCNADADCPVEYACIEGRCGAP